MAARKLRPASPREDFPALDEAHRNIQNVIVGIKNADGYDPPNTTRLLAKKNATVEMWERDLTTAGFADEDVAKIVEALDLYHQAWKVTPFNTEGQPRKRSRTVKRINL